MVESVQETIMEQRKELMVSPTGGIPTLRKAHFLKPSVSSIDGPPMKLPFLTPKPRWPLEVNFNGWRDPIKKWDKWVDKMESRYNSVWKKVGIYEAIMSSTYKIYVDSDLIFGLAERWCSETNTFIFPWGEATVTLEDMLILGGFSVLGSPVSLPLDSPELVSIRDFLVRLDTNIHSKWLKMFMGTGSEYEHEAFLSLWLSRCVLPGNQQDKIGEQIFRIAIHLARGTRVALAPAVLASIYRDMGLLRGSMVASTQMEAFDSFLVITLWSPLCYVQVWAWERLPPMHPRPNSMNSGQLRLARWEGLKYDIGNVRPAINYAGETFLWRPYALALDNWSIPKFYKEKEAWVVCKDMDCAFESLARCLKVCKLLGMDCEEPYNPHRVAMQFGYDQDLPGWVSRDSKCPDMAWYNFFKPLSDDEMLYLPSRLSESDVTTRYLEWWRKTVLCPVNAFKGVVKRRRSSRVPHNRPHKSKQLKTGNAPLATLQTRSKFQCNEGLPRKVKPLQAALFQSVSPMIGGVGLSIKIKPVVKLEEDTEQHNSRNYPDVPPGFLLKSVDIKGKSTRIQRLIKQEEDASEVAGIIKTNTAADKFGQSKQLKTLRYLDVPPGFPPRHKQLKTVHYPDTPPGFSPKCMVIEKKCNEERSSCNVPYKMQHGITLEGRSEQAKLAKGKSIVVEERSHGNKNGEKISIQNANSMTRSESTRILELEACLSVIETELARLKK
ncbi:Hypothetical predicted protein [Olea europaea subsp. europaea]|uniref:Aminotransferase-like plant mobile domain-containing protein n=1 Tax=Olea europaea subsp. europaea TaxID=158383 RepID=A0A8S0TT40_OLEEU|nr:Hypothetical predicted protein [Olea europaea subsp. europaea]